MYYICVLATSWRYVHIETRDPALPESTRYMLSVPAHCVREAFYLPKSYRTPFHERLFTRSVEERTRAPDAQGSLTGVCAVPRFWISRRLVQI